MSDDKTENGKNKPIILTGKQNYIAWYRCIRHEADIKGLWPYINSETSVPLKPVFVETEERRQELLRQMAEDLARQHAQGIPATPKVEYLISFDMYKYKKDEYDLAMKEERLARKLLFDRVDHSFLAIMQGKDSAVEQAQALAVTCRMSDADGEN